MPARPGVGGWMVTGRCSAREMRKPAGVGHGWAINGDPADYREVGDSLRLGVSTDDVAASIFGGSVNADDICGLFV